MFLATALFTLALSQQPTPAPTPVPDVNVTQRTAAEQAAAEEEARRNEIVCRREHIVGSNRPQRICQTRAQWERLTENSREALRDDRFQTGQGRGPGESVGG